MSVVGNLITQVIDAPTVEGVVELMCIYASRVRQDIALDLARSLSSPRQDVRAVALSRLLLNICYGVDTERGADLAEGYLTFLVERWASLPFHDRSHLEHLCVATLSACVYAHFQEGRWQRCAEFLEVAAGLPGVGSLEQYWNAPAIVIRIKVANNDVAAAEKLLAQIPAGVGVAAPHVDLARSVFAEFMQRRFELEERRPTEAQAKDIWERSFSDNIATLDRLAGTLGRAGQQVITFGAAELQPLQRRLEDMREMARAPVPFEQKYAQLSLANVEWREQLFLLLNPGADRDRPSAEWVSRVIDYASCLVATADPEKQSIERCLHDLSSAEEWSRKCGDWHRVWMSVWARLLLFARRSIDEGVRDCAQSLIASIRQRRRMSAEPEVRGNIANFLPGLTAKCCQFHNPSEDPRLLFAACELRKSRSLLASRALLPMEEAEGIAPLACGARTHYLSYTALHREDQIYACLYTADGHVRAGRLPIDVATVTRFASRLQSNRPEGYFVQSDQRAPREALASLALPLEEALLSGQIAVGDHVCIAADDPVNLIPLHGLLVAGRAAVLCFSFSRVASFEDAQWLAKESVSRPGHAVSMRIPTVSKAAAESRAHFDGTARVLSAELPGVVVAGEEPMTGSDVITYLRASSLIHIYAHGAFVEATNPYTHSGLVVSDGRGLPALDGDPKRLLTPRMLLEQKPDLSGSHITLCACVSGLGLEGKGGD
ncbi:MAG TPA: hypothetical protein VI653_09030, partial [Steroidobacteraceae bacterium]